MSEGIIIRRKVEKSCEATISLGNMQFLKIRSVMTQEVEGTEEELVKFDRALWHDVAMDVRRGLWTTLSDMGKTTDADKAFFETCRQKVVGAQPKKEGENKS